VQRVRATLQYDGTQYRGWQRQIDATTVQGACEAALERIVGPSDFDHEGRLSPRELRRAWNAQLPADVWVSRLESAAPRFHARHDATARTYRYHLALGRQAFSPFVRRYAWPMRRALDWEAMEAATREIVGRHDFRRFAKGAGDARTRAEDPGGCTVQGARWLRSREGRALELTADRFLRHMVRAIVGSIVAVGQGRIGPDAVRDALAPGGDRPRAGYAPPQGLFLWAVEYPEEERSA